MKLRHDLVLITWDDAAQLNLGWMDESEVVAQSMLVRTVGFIVRKTKRHMIVAGTIGDHAHCHQQFQIPVKMIQSIEVVGKKGTEFPQPVRLDHANTEDDSEASTAGARRSGKARDAGSSSTGAEAAEINATAPSVND